MLSKNNDNIDNINIDKEPSVSVESVETIVAQATSPGRGGIAIVRISGPLVRKMMPPLLNCESLIPRQATYLSFLDASLEAIDEGIALFFPQPHSFTGEDVLELHGHGGPVVVDLLLQRVLQLGARLARAGEFSERAFLNNKMDLTQAEAIADLIDAASIQAARVALRSLQGDFSKIIYTINEEVIHLRTLIEASIDFSDEDITFLTDQRIHLQLKNIIAQLEKIIQQAKQGALLREGMTAVIAGEPNVGKSSLLNALSGEELAIVTAIPGTTRDVLREKILIDDLPLHIIDTAGLRESEDIIEQEGIRRAKKAIETADIVLHVSDATKEIGQEEILESYPNQSIIFIRNKIDLLTNNKPRLEKRIAKNVPYTTIFLSVRDGLGLELLKQALKSHMGYDHHQEGLFLARRRHLEALSRAREHLLTAANLLQTLTSIEILAEELRLAQLALSEITGEWAADDLLGRIFASFCIGK